MLEEEVMTYYPFQSTPFARRETMSKDKQLRTWIRFNPLPSQEGRHNQYLIFLCRLQCFNPLPSQEGRHGAQPVKTGSGTFQSTPFARRETIPV